MDGFKTTATSWTRLLRLRGLRRLARVCPFCFDLAPHPPNDICEPLRIACFRRFQLLFLLDLATTSAISPASAQEEAAKLKVVATFSILGDFARNVGQNQVDVMSLVGPNGDVHVYAPTPADAEAIRNARLVIINGLGLEGWLPRLVESSGGNATTVVATRGIVPRTIAAGEILDRDHGARAPDPHAWQSVPNAETYVVNIRDAMVSADPANAATYRANAAAYLTKLEALDRDVREAVARIPINRRKVISTHDAFGYFAAAYGGRFNRTRAERAGHRNDHHDDQEREDSGGLPGKRQRSQTHAPNCVRNRHIDRRNVVFGQFDQGGWRGSHLHRDG